MMICRILVWKEWESKGRGWGKSHHLTQSHCQHGIFLGVLSDSRKTFEAWAKKSVCRNACPHMLRPIFNPFFPYPTPPPPPTPRDSLVICVTCFCFYSYSVPVLNTNANLFVTLTTAINVKLFVLNKNNNIKVYARWQAADKTLECKLSEQNNA